MSASREWAIRAELAKAGELEALAIYNDTRAELVQAGDWEALARFDTEMWNELLDWRNPSRIEARDARVEAMQADLATLQNLMDAGDPKAEALLDHITAEQNAMAIADGRPPPHGPGLLDQLDAEWRARRRRRVMGWLGILAFFLIGLYFTDILRALR